MKPNPTKPPHNIPECIIIKVISSALALVRIAPTSCAILNTDKTCYKLHLMDDLHPLGLFLEAMALRVWDLRQEWVSTDFGKLKSQANSSQLLQVLHHHQVCNQLISSLVDPAASPPISNPQPICLSSTCTHLSYVSAQDLLNLAWPREAIQAGEIKSLGPPVPAWALTRVWMRKDRLYARA